MTSKRRGWVEDGQVVFLSDDAVATFDAVAHQGVLLRMGTSTIEEIIQCMVHYALTMVGSSLLPSTP